MARRKIKHTDGAEAIAAVKASGLVAADQNILATACRYLLEELAERSPGNSVEVRVPIPNPRKRPQNPQQPERKPQQLQQFPSIIARRW